MIKLFTAFATLAVALPVSATPLSTEVLGARCEAGSVAHCEELATVTNGQCAGPQGSGCRYTLEIVQPESLMVNVPNFGQSRMETVTMCLQDAGVEKYQDMITDMQFETFEFCMSDNT